MAIQKLTNYKAPGTDNMPAGLFECGGNESVKHLYTTLFGERKICQQNGM